MEFYYGLVFWFKFTCIISFTDGIFKGVGLFNYTNESFDEALIVSQIGIFAFIFAGYMREYFLFKYQKKIEFENLKISFLNLIEEKYGFFFLLFF